MYPKIIIAASTAVGGMLAATSSANAAAYTFTAINVPATSGTRALGINDSGQIAGSTGGFRDGAQLPRYRQRLHHDRRVWHGTYLKGGRDVE
jgi:uncharacterized membrane protein